METRWNECEKYLHIIHFPLSLFSQPLFQAELRPQDTDSRFLVARFCDPRTKQTNNFVFSWIPPFCSVRGRQR